MRITIRVDWRDADEDDIGALARLYVQKPVRFRRPLEDFRATLAAFRIQVRAGPGRTLVAEVGDRVTAYVSALMRCRDGVLTLETSETGGDPEATIDLAATLAADQGIDSFDLAVPGAHEALSNACERRGFARVDKPESGTFKLLDPERFVDRFRPLFAERADSEPASNLEVVNKGGGCSFQLNDERLYVTTEADLLRLVFEPGWEAGELPAGPLGTFLATAFSLPMIMPGFNYA